ncbi:MAG: flagellar basal body P-ring protein FlgI [Planctomycetota bacterium]|jgi:hypothetical protein
MNLIHRKAALLITALLTVYFVGGCGGPGRSGRGAQDYESPAELGATIGSLVSILVPEPLPVEGFGLVVGLKGTGSAECPPQIRSYLRQYILRQLPAKTRIDVDKFINSPNTAVVSVQGVIPAIASKNQYFDVRVGALPGTQTTSLNDGRLFTSELRMSGSLRANTRILADVEGPVYIDKIENTGIDNKTGYILAGGKVLDEYKIILSLNEADFGMVNQIRNRINGRFNDAAAKAVSPDRVEFIVPPKYIEQKQRFVSIIAAMFLTQEPAINSKRISTYVKGLSDSPNKYSNELALEAIGNECLNELGLLLESSDEKIRLHAGRCMLNLGSDAGLVALRQIALDKKSADRIEALESITLSAKRNDAVSISRKLLRDDDFRIMLAAYEKLRKLDDVAVMQEFIGRSFYLERVTQTEHKTVFVSRNGQPRFVLLGSPIYCNSNIFVEFGKGDIIINAPSGQKYVNIIRKHPRRPSAITQLKSTFEIGDIIRTLCDEPVKEDGKGSGGLGVSYADAAALLKQMCDMGVVKAEFHAGPMPKIGLNIKK